MKTNCLILVIFSLACTNHLFSQTEKGNYKIVAGKFEDNYNKGNYDTIFHSFSPDMQKALPLHEANAFLSGLKQEAGLIAKREFIRYESSYAVYKTEFDKALLSLSISIDGNNKIDGFLVKPYVGDTLPKIERNISKFTLPFKNQWYVTWGGDTKELNYHIESVAQKNAFDFVIRDKSGKTYKTDGIKNEDYYAFGQDIIAPCDGEIILVVDGVKDNKPGILNPVYVPGNTVILKTAHGEYLFFAHFKQHSIKVKQGDKVKQGKLLGLCGNSGNSSEPHLHFHIQNAEDMNIATGIKCYFESLIVDGEKVKNDYSPIRGEHVSNK